MSRCEGGVVFAPLMGGEARKRGFWGLIYRFAGPGNKVCKMAVMSVYDGY